MKTRHILGISISLLASITPGFCLDEDVFGDYVSTEKGHVHVKKVSILKTKDGKIKARVTLSGYPDDLNLGETIVAVYPERDKSFGDRLMGTLSTPKLTDTFVIETQAFSNNYLQGGGWFLNVTSYLTYKDGRPSVYFETGMGKALQEK